MLLLRHHKWHHHLALLLALILCAVDLESLVSGKASSIFVGAADQNNEAAQGEDSEEVERILSATDVVQKLTKQREKHRLQLIEIEKNMETEIKTFYTKHDAALSKLRVIDSELRQRVSNLESKIIAEAQNLKARAPSYSSWLLPFCGLLLLVVGVYVYLGRAITKSVSSKSF